MPDATTTTPPAAAPTSTSSAQPTSTTTTPPPSVAAAAASAIDPKLAQARTIMRELGLHSRVGSDDAPAGDVEPAADATPGGDHADTTTDAAKDDGKSAAAAVADSVGKSAADPGAAAGGEEGAAAAAAAADPNAQTTDDATDVVDPTDAATIAAEDAKLAQYVGTLRARRQEIAPKLTALQKQLAEADDFNPMDPAAQREAMKLMLELQDLSDKEHQVTEYKLQRNEELRAADATWDTVTQQYEHVSAKEAKAWWMQAQKDQIKAGYKGDRMIGRAEIAWQTKMDRTNAARKGAATRSEAVTAEPPKPAVAAAAATIVKKAAPKISLPPPNTPVTKGAAQVTSQGNVGGPPAPLPEDPNERIKMNAYPALAKDLRAFGISRSRR